MPARASRAGPTGPRLRDLGPLRTRRGFGVAGLACAGLLVLLGAPAGAAPELLRDLSGPAPRPAGLEPWLAGERTSIWTGDGAWRIDHALERPPAPLGPLARAAELDPRVELGDVTVFLSGDALMRTDGTPRGTWALMWPPRRWGGLAGWSLVEHDGWAYLLAEGRDYSVSLFRTDGDVVERVERFEKPEPPVPEHSPLFSAGGALWFSLSNDTHRHVMRTDGGPGQAARALELPGGAAELTGAVTVGGRALLAVEGLGLVEVGPNGAVTVRLEHDEIKRLHRAPGADVAWAVLYDRTSTRFARVTPSEVDVFGPFERFPSRRWATIRNLAFGDTVVFSERGRATVTCRADGQVRSFASLTALAAGPDALFAALEHRGEDDAPATFDVVRIDGREDAPETLAAGFSSEVAPGLLALEDGAMLAARPAGVVELVRFEPSGARAAATQTLTPAPAGQSLGELLPSARAERVWAARGRDLVRLDPATGQDAEVFRDAEPLGLDEGGRLFFLRQDLLQGTQLRTADEAGEQLVRAFSSSRLEAVGVYRGQLVFWRHRDSEASRLWIATATGAARLTDWDPRTGARDVYVGPEGIEVLRTDPDGLWVERVDPVTGARAEVVPRFEAPGARHLVRRGAARYLLGHERLGGGRYRLRAWSLDSSGAAELPIDSGPETTYEIDVDGDLVRHGRALFRFGQGGLRALEGLRSVSEVAQGPGGLYLSGESLEAGRELWFWADDGALRALEVVPGPVRANPTDLLPTEDGRVVFVATDPDLGRELFVADARTGDVRALTDLRAGPLSGALTAHRVQGDEIWLEGLDDAGRRGLFRLSLAEASAPCSLACEDGARCIGGACRGGPAVGLPAGGCGCRATGGAGDAEGWLAFALAAGLSGRRRLRATPT